MKVQWQVKGSTVWAAKIAGWASGHVNNLTHHYDDGPMKSRKKLWNISLSMFWCASERIKGSGSLKRGNCPGSTAMTLTTLADDVRDVICLSNAVSAIPGGMSLHFFGSPN